MSNNLSNTQNKIFDLHERTAVFGESIVRFSKTIPENTITRSMIVQLINCGTSTGANYCEADDAESRKDFIHKLGISKKEARECGHWLHMIVVACPELKDEARTLFKESKEINLIINAIINSTKRHKEYTPHEIGNW